MYSVNVNSDGQTFFVEVCNKRINYVFVGEVFPAGDTVDGRYQGEVKAFEDAADWRAKLKAAGLKVE